jgi:hypothetical protein
LKLFGYGVPIVRTILIHQLAKLLIFSRPPMASGTHPMKIFYLNIQQENIQLEKKKGKKTLAIYAQS